jgi:hypothetical protein
MMAGDTSSLTAVRSRLTELLIWGRLRVFPLIINTITQYSPFLELQSVRNVRQTEDRDAPTTSRVVA